MSSQESHSHSHDLAASSRTRLAIAFTITTTVLIAQIVGAVLTGSLALLVDSAHMAVDSVGLLMALFASILITRPRSSRRSWGWLRAEIIAAGAQATVLLAVGIYAMVEGIQRLASPAPAEEFDVVLLGVIGVVGLLANIASLLVLTAARQNSLNMRAAFLEVLNDALGSVAVIVAAVVIATTGWTGADAVAGMLIALLIIPRAARILRESGSVLMESAPRGLDLEEVAAHLETVPRVVAVHDLHASLVATGVPVLTAHIVVEDAVFHDGGAPGILDALQSCAAEHFPVSVEHATFQLEPADHVDHEVLGHGPIPPSDQRDAEQKEHAPAQKCAQAGDCEGMLRG
ncbi:cation diffusion facilitator family transporter [Kocuria sp.]|uniref:cation diffusion facilitator family transporter n=1 Tax=Kocuria sp. TaxID=1871328 RepID=UPI0026DF5384|nr:cation diffusion facilitator family transporter [Kocuria sp.]MDO5618590.1 cation diffusion facilitator family transporter [Kocuria sp.]